MDDENTGNVLELIHALWELDDEFLEGAKEGELNATPDAQATNTSASLSAVGAINEIILNNKEGLNLSGSTVSVLENYKNILSPAAFYLNLSTLNTDLKKFNTAYSQNNWRVEEHQYLSICIDLCNLGSAIPLLAPEFKALSLAFFIARNTFDAYYPQNFWIGGAVDVTFKGKSDPNTFEFISPAAGSAGTKMTIDDSEWGGTSTILVGGASGVIPLTGTSNICTSNIYSSDGGTLCSDTWVDNSGTTYQFISTALSDGVIQTEGNLYITNGAIGSGSTIEIQDFDLEQAESGTGNGYDGIHFSEQAAIAAGSPDNPFASNGEPEDAGVSATGKVQDVTFYASTISNTPQTVYVTLSGAALDQFGFDYDFGGTGSSEFLNYSSGQYSFTIPAGQSSVTVGLTYSGNLSQPQSVSINSTIENGNGTSNASNSLTVNFPSDTPTPVTPTIIQATPGEIYYVTISPNMVSDSTQAVRLTSDGPIALDTAAGLSSLSSTPIYIPPNATSVTVGLVYIGNPAEIQPVTVTASNGFITNPQGGNSVTLDYSGPTISTFPTTVDRTNDNGLAGSILAMNVYNLDNNADQVTAGSGVNYIAGPLGYQNTNSNDTITGGNGQDVIVLGDGNNQIFAGTSVLTLTQALNQMSNNVATNEKGDFIGVGDGNNTLVGSNGDDLVSVGTGANVIVMGAGNDTFSGGEEGSNAALDWSALPIVSASIALNLAPWYDISSTPAPFSAPDGYEGSGLIEPSGALTPLGPGDDTIYGGTGDSIFWLPNGNNFIDAGGGNDSIQASLGNNTIDGGNGNDVIFGGGGNDQIVVGSGDDFITGQGGNMTIYGGTGNDTIFSGDNADTAVNGTSWSNSQSGNGYLVAGSGNSQLYGAGGNDTLLGGSGNTTLNAGDGNEYLEAGSGTTEIFGGVGNDTLIGGSGNDTIQAVQTGSATTLIVAGDGNASINGGAGNETIQGGGGSDTLIGGSGNSVIYANDGGTDFAPTQILVGSGNTTVYAGSGVDSIVGGNGSATYIVGSDAGEVGIYSAGAGDILQFASGISLSDVSVSENDYTNGIGYTLTLDSGGVVYVAPGSLSQATFADGGTFTLAELAQSSFESDGTTYSWNNVQLTSGLQSNLTLLGSNDLVAQGNNESISIQSNRGNDTLVSGDANDTLIGGGLSDDYYVSGGAGLVTTINDSSGSDAISFGAGVNLADLTASATNDANGSVTITIANSAGGTTVINGAYGQIVDQLSFADGSTGSLSQLLAQNTASPSAATSSTNVILSGSLLTMTLTTDANLSATANNLNDEIIANAGVDTLIAGTGNDTFIGGGGVANYVVGSQSGNVTIENSASADTLVFGTGVLEQDLIAGSAEVNGVNIVTLTNMLNDSTITIDGGNLSNVTFADGNAATISQLLSPTFTLGSTSYSNVSTTLGSGLTGLDMTGVTAVTATANGLNDVIQSNFGDDTLIAGTGNDTLLGGYGSTTYEIAAGDQVTTINQSNSSDTLSFGSGVTLADLSMSTTVNADGSVAVTIQNSLGGSVVIDGNLGLMVDQLSFIDGSTASLSQLLAQQTPSATAATSAISVTLAETTLNMTLTGTANISATGNDLNDVISANSGNDTLIAGTANDTLIGGGGVATYQVNDNGGNVTIQNGSASDTLSFGSGISELDVTASSAVLNGVNVVTLTNQYGGTVTIEGGNLNNIVYADGFTTTVGELLEPTYTLDTTTFSTVNVTAGTGITGLGLLGGTNVTATANALNDVISANSGNDTIVAGSGDDTIIGGSGNDVFVAGSGSLTVEDVTSSDLLNLGLVGLSTLSANVINDNGATEVTITSSTGQTFNLDSTSVSIVYGGNAAMQLSQFLTLIPTIETTYNADGSYTTTSNDGQGDVLTQNFGSSGMLLGDTWTHANGTSGQDNYNLDGSSNGLTINADGSYSAYSKDSEGDLLTQFFNATGTLTNDSWSHSDGSSGTDTYNANGSTSGTTRDPNGNYSTYTNDGAGNELTKTYNSAGALIGDSWTNANGTSGNDAYGVNGNTTISTLIAADGSYTVTSNDGIGDTFETQYTAAGVKTSDNWTASDGAVGNDTFNADGTSSGVAINSDGSYSSYTTDASGNTVTDEFNSSKALTETIQSNASGDSLTTNVVTGATVNKIVNGDGSYSVTTNDALGDITTNNYSSANGLTSDSWQKENGTSGQDVFNSNGSSFGTVINADGTSSKYTNDGQGDITTQYFNASGVLVSNAWQKANGQTGTDTYNVDGSGNGVIKNVNGSYVDFTFNSAGTVLASSDYSANGTLLSSTGGNSSGAASAGQSSFADFLADGVYSTTSFNADGQGVITFYNSSNEVTGSTTYVVPTDAQIQNGLGGGYGGPLSVQDSLSLTQDFADGTTAEGSFVMATDPYEGDVVMQLTSLQTADPVGSPENPSGGSSPQTLPTLESLGAESSSQEETFGGTPILPTYVTEYVQESVTSYTTEVQAIPVSVSAGASNVQDLSGNTSTPGLVESNGNVYDMNTEEVPTTKVENVAVQVEVPPQVQSNYVEVTTYSNAVDTKTYANGVVISDVTKYTDGSQSVTEYNSTGNFVSNTTTYANGMYSVQNASTNLNVDYYTESGQFIGYGVSNNYSNNGYTVTAYNGESISDPFVYPGNTSVVVYNDNNGLYENTTFPLITNDGKGDTVTYDFGLNSLYMTWQDADGTTGTGNFDLSNNSGVETMNYTDGTYSTATNDGTGNFVVDNYSAAGVLLSEEWGDASGLTGSETFVDAQTLSDNGVASTLTGNSGADTFIVGNTGTTVVEEVNGNSTVETSVSYTMPANVQNLVGTGSSSLVLTGGMQGGETISANSGNDTLVAASGIVTLNGGAGNDTFVINNASDVINAVAGSNTNTIATSISTTLAANVQNLTGLGSSAISLTGNNLNNIIVANAGSDTLNGGSGNATLIAGTGNDTMNSGSLGGISGTTTFVLNGGGNDLINAGQNDVLSIGADFGSLSEISETGNQLIISNGIYNDTINGALNSVVVGNAAPVSFATFLSDISDSHTLSAGSGNVTLTAGSGNYTLNAGSGNDSLVDGSGNDTMSSGSLGGGSGITTFVLNGNANDVINAGANDVLSIGTNFGSLTEVSDLNNQLVISNGTNNDTINGAFSSVVLPGEAALPYASFLADMIDPTGASQTLTGGWNAATNSAQYAESGNGYTGLLPGVTSYNLTGTNIAQTTTSGNFELSTSADGNTLTAGSGNDTLSAVIGSNFVTLSGGVSASNPANSNADTTFQINAASGVYQERNVNQYYDNTTIENANNSDIINLQNLNSPTSSGSPIYNEVNFSINVAPDINSTVTGAIDILIGVQYKTSNGALYSANPPVSTFIDLVVTPESGYANQIDFDGNALTTVDAILQADMGPQTSSTSTTLAYYADTLTLTGTGSVSGTGNLLDDIITANSGNDTLIAGSGVDTLNGGTGNDTFVINNSADVVNAVAGSNINTVQTSVSETAGANIKALTGTGSAALTLTGNTFANTITANSGNDTLVAGTGVATLIGGAGNDTFVIDNKNDVITEAANTGDNIEQTSVSTTLAANVQNLVGVGTASLSLTGNALANTITANSGNDTLVSGSGIATLIGGAGNDLFEIGNINDVVTQVANGGNNTEESWVDATLANNVQNLTGSGSGAITLRGNAQNDVITANSGADLLIGGSGNDTLIAGSGNDTLESGTGIDNLVGGSGNDLFEINNSADTITDTSTSSVNSEQTTVSTTLANNVQNLTATGTAAVTLTGNSLASNLIAGNAGADTLIAGSGNDTLMTGSGITTLIGGAGNDVFDIDNASDVISEAANSGNNTEESWVSVTLAANVQNISGMGTGSVTLIGNTLNNVITGNGGSDWLAAGTGNDTLIAGTGVDTLDGSTGNDTFVVNNASDHIIASSSAVLNTIVTTVNYTASANVEDLIVTGTGAITATGNTSSNLIVGGSGNDSLVAGTGVAVIEAGSGATTLKDTTSANALIAGGGNDTLIGGTGASFIAAGAGTDTITLGAGKAVVADNSGDGAVTITPGSGTANVLSLGGGIAYANLTFTKSGNNLILNTGGSNVITFTNWYAGAADQNFVTLQVIEQAASSYNASSTNTLYNSEIETFNLTQLVSQFNAAGQTSGWSLMNDLLTDHLSSSNSAALGGDLGYYDGLNGNLTGLNLATAVTTLQNASFGKTAQTVDAWSGISTTNKLH